MNIDRHHERLNESIEVIDDSITKDITKRQRTIGFSCSAGAVDMLEIYLHMENLIDPGFVIKHEWFKSKNKLKDKIPFHFENKNSILKSMEKIEERRNSLCYGAPKEEEVVRGVILEFNNLKKIFNKMGVEIEKK